MKPVTCNNISTLGGIATNWHEQRVLNDLWRARLRPLPLPPFRQHIAPLSHSFSHGEYFQIARGAPQGDRSSPYIFIICIEILILKLECDETGHIRGIERRVGVYQRAGLGDGLLEAFADDLTVQFIWSIMALGRIFVILDELGR